MHTSRTLDINTFGVIKTNQLTKEYRGNYSLQILNEKKKCYMSGLQVFYMMISKRVKFTSNQKGIHRKKEENLLSPDNFF